MSEQDEDEQSVVEEVRRLAGAIEAAVDQLEHLEDPAAQALGAGVLLTGWPAQQKRLRVLRQNAVLRMRAEKVTYRDIARRLKISVARVQQIEAGETGRTGRAPAKRKTNPPSTEGE